MVSLPSGQRHACLITTCFASAGEDLSRTDDFEFAVMDDRGGIFVNAKEQHFRMVAYEQTFRESCQSRKPLGNSSLHEPSAVQHQPPR